MFLWARRQQYWAVLGTQVFLLFVVAVMHEHPLLSILFVLALFGIFGSVIRTIWDSLLPRTLSLVSAALAILCGLLQLLPWVSSDVAEGGVVVSCFAYACFILIAIISIGRHVFITDRVTANRIVGSICVYMLIGMFFAFVYASMGLIERGTFDFGPHATASAVIDLRDFVYFSYSTLTTTGYGDVTPVHPIARMVTCIEEVAGSVYLAIMVARLVGMHVVQARESKGH